MSQTKERKRLRKARAARRQAEAHALTEAALSIACPTCRVQPGLWCYTRGALGPDMHERRWQTAQSLTPPSHPA